MYEAGWVMVGKRRWMHMKALRTSLVVLAVLAGSFGVAKLGHAQVPGGVTLAFRNDMPGPIIVQGASMINNQLRRGQPIVIAKGKIGHDHGVPAGVRFITIYDAMQPSRILLANFPLPVQGRASYSVAAGLGGQVKLVPITGQ